MYSQSRHVKPTSPRSRPVQVQVKFIWSKPMEGICQLYSIHTSYMLACVVYNCTWTCPVSNKSEGCLSVHLCQFTAFLGEICTDRMSGCIHSFLIQYVTIYLPMPCSPDPLCGHPYALKSKLTLKLLNLRNRFILL